MRAAVISVSSTRSAGRGEDVSGPALAALLERVGCEVAAVELIPDERELIAGRLRYYADEDGCELIATTGGAGLAPEEVTPEATRDVIDREVPGIAEALRLAEREHRPDEWPLGRGVAGTRARTLIVNFPAEPEAIERAGGAVAGALATALERLRGRGERRGQQPAT